MKELMKALEATEAKANKADSEWEADPENKELEKAFDEAYAAEHKAFEALVEKIVSITSGRIDEKTAATLIRSKCKELESLISRIA